jgi:hypothetical protein
VNPYLLHGDAETAIVNLCGYLNSRGVDNTLITLAVEEDYFKDSNVNIKVKAASLNKNQIRKSESTQKALSLIPDALALRKLFQNAKTAAT